MTDQRKYWQNAASPNKIRYIDKYGTGKTALDIGCGAGHYARFLRQKGFEVIGLDFEPRSDLEFACIQAPMSAIPLAGSFDTVLAFDVLEHEANETLALAELRRITKKRLILSVPNADDHLLTPYNLTYKHHIDKTHYREYAKKDICQKLEQYGFQVIDVNYEGPVNPALLAEFIRPKVAQPFFKFIIMGLFKLNLLQNNTLYADIFIVAEPTQSTINL